MNTSIVLSKKTFNAAVTRMKALFDNDRKKAAEALSQGLYAEDYNVTVSKLNGLPKTANGVFSKLNEKQLNTMGDNLLSLLTDVRNFKLNKVFFVSNATDMLNDFMLNDMEIENTELVSLLNEIQSTVEDIKKYNDVTRLQISGFDEVTKTLSDFERQYCINASLQTERLLLEWKCITIERSDYEGSTIEGDIDDPDGFNFTVNGIHYLTWLESFKLSKEDYEFTLPYLQDFITSIQNANDSYSPNLTISAELATLLQAELA